MVIGGILYSIFRIFGGAAAAISGFSSLRTVDVVGNASCGCCGADGSKGDVLGDVESLADRLGYNC